MNAENRKSYKMVLAALFLALALVLPFITGQIPKIGNALCPMHFPVILCGYLCGPWYGLAVGLIAPLFRSLLFGTPPLLPKAVAMSCELAVYGLSAGFLYRLFPKTKLNLYVSLVLSMLAGRLVWGIARTLLYGVGGYEFGWELFLSGAFLTAIPGIILQIILIPLLVTVLEKYGKEQERNA